MVERSRYGRGRLPSEQVENLRTNFAYALSTRTPEPRLEAASETSQPVTISSSALPKRKRSNTNVLRNSKPHNASLEPELDLAVETPQPTRLGLSLSAPPTRKRKRTTDVVSELEAHNKSPEPESASGSEARQSVTRGSSQLPSRKRRSKMLRELDPHNESPEQESEPDIGMVQESTKGAFFTRSAAREFKNFLKNKTPTPPKDLNIKRLMYAELSGTPKGTKTWYFPNDRNPGSSSQQRQPEPRQSIDVNIKEEDEERSLWENIRTSGGSRSQSRSSTGRTMSQQSRKSSGNSRQDQAVALESAWSMWDREKGQSSLTLHSLLRYFKALSFGDLPTLPPITLLSYLYIYQYIHRHICLAC